MLSRAAARRVYTAASRYGSVQHRMMSMPSFATIDADALSGSKPGHVMNLLDGKWVETAKTRTLPDPWNGEPFLHVAQADAQEAVAYGESLMQCPKSGLHNPFKKPERYVQMGEIASKAAALLRDPAIEHYFTRLVQRVSPKSYVQAQGEVRVSGNFLNNFSGDQVRFLAQSFGTSGDHLGQETRGYRYPFGAVGLITPFNFPIEIPVLQMMGALFMGNKPLVHVDTRVSMVMEQFIRMLVEECGLDPHDLIYMNAEGSVVGDLFERIQPRSTLFTGSSTVAELLSAKLNGKVKLEDAGFDWKVLGPDPPTSQKEIDYVAWQSDQDAYASTGQKCSAQSMLFMHKNWSKTDFLQKIEQLAARRNMTDETVGPVITWTTDAILDHVKKVSSLPGAKVLFGGKALSGHSVPDVYGAVEPTAVFVPLEELLKPGNYELCTKELFGPFQVITEYTDEDVPKVLDALERMTHHLTAAIVSKDDEFREHMLGSTINGTTYAGLRARTTGAPANHWFGPAGDPRCAGIGTREAIRLVWSCHREIVHDVGPVPRDWEIPQAS